MIDWATNQKIHLHEACRWFILSGSKKPDVWFNMANEEFPNFTGFLPNGFIFNLILTDCHEMIELLKRTIANHDDKSDADKRTLLELLSRKLPDSKISAMLVMMDLSK